MIRLESNTVEAQLLSSGIKLAALVPYASQPLYIGPITEGCLQIIASPANNPNGFKVKMQGSNVKLPDPLTTDYTTAVKSILDYGGANPTDLGWTDLDVNAVFPGGLASGFLPPPTQNPAVSFRTTWVRVVVTPQGPGTLAVDIWAKFQSGV